MTNLFKEMGIQSTQIEKDYNNILTKVSIALLDYRQANALSQKELADELGVSVSFVKKVENGEVDLRLKNLVEICNKTGYHLMVKSLI